MKKIITLATCAFIAVTGMISCSETSERACQDVANKIQNHEELTNDDYTRMIEYIGEYAQKTQELAVNDPSNDYQGAIEKLNEEYPLVETFQDCIKNTPVDKFDADNLALLKKYGGLINFSLPEGFEISTDPEAAGLEVAAPDSNDQNGVIVGAVDEEKVEQK